MPLSTIDSSGLATAGIARINMYAGAVLQVVSTTKLDAFTTTSGTAVDVTGLSVSITPSSASSKILVMAMISGGPDTTTGWYMNLVRNSTNLAISTAGSSYNSTIGSYFNDSTNWVACPITYLDSPATTSSTTYKIQTFSGNPGVGVVAINRRANDAVIGASSSITVMEIAA
jgi:hypothetical protein